MEGTGLVRLSYEHLLRLQEKGAISYIGEWANEENFKALERYKFSFSALDDDGDVLACCGVVDWWPGRGEAWAFFDPNIKEKFIGVHKKVLRFLEVCPVRRLEAIVDYNFTAGHRWMRMLGFEVEAKCMRYYTQDGRDVTFYSRIRE